MPFEDLNPAATALLPAGLAVAESALVGFFPQSSSDLLQDYDELLAKLDPDSASSLEQSLNAARDVLPAPYRPAFNPPAGAEAPDQPIVYSDPSRRVAVLRSRASTTPPWGIIEDAGIPRYLGPGLDGVGAG